MKTKNLIRLGKVSLVCLGLFAASCSNESFDELPQEVSDTPLLVEKFFRGNSIQVEKLENGMFRWGDVDFMPEQLQDEQTPYEPHKLAPGEVDPKLGLASGVRKWPNNTVIYVLDGSLTNRQRDVTFSSMQEWSSKTNIKFKERTNENYYVTIKNDGQNCNCGRANLGVNGTRGSIIIGTRTGTGVMIHEIGHTLGYLHEQNRSDRDQFVDIFPQNIQDGAISQFRIDQGSTLPGGFDLESIMIYSSFTFSKNGQPVMLAKDGSRIPFRSVLSAGDIAGTNQLYPAGDGGGGDGGGGDTDTCEGVDEWVPGRRYQVGDRVTYQGSLYERDFSRWNRIKECDATNPPADICDGVEPYNGSTRYGLGDKVTFRGSLYEVVQSNGRLVWQNQGQCGTN